MNARYAAVVCLMAASAEVRASFRSGLRLLNLLDIVEAQLQEREQPLQRRSVVEFR